MYCYHINMFFDIPILIKIVNRHVYLHAYGVHICYIKIHLFAPHPRLINPISDIKGSIEIIKIVGGIVIRERNEAGNTRGTWSRFSHRSLNNFCIDLQFQ